jgi:hypothetical protein
VPWTRRQVRFLESSGSPLTVAQKAKMNQELHSDPSMGHKKKGSEAMKKAPFHMTHITHHDDGSHSVEHEPHSKPTKGGAFIERGDNVTYSAGDSKELMAKLQKHIGSKGAQDEAQQDKEPEAEVEHEEETVA